MFIYNLLYIEEIPINRFDSGLRHCKAPDFSGAFFRLTTLWAVNPFYFVVNAIVYEYNKNVRRILRILLFKLEYAIMPIGKKITVSMMAHEKPRRL